MTLSRITLRLARNPGTDFPDGDPDRGYVLVAPLTADKHLDEGAWKQHKTRCTVRHFSPDLQNPEMGVLNRRGNNWFFDYDADRTDDDEPIFKLGLHSFDPNEFVTITDEDGTAWTYRVTEVVAVSETA